MTKRNCFIMLAAVLCLFWGFGRSEKSFAKDKELKAEEVVAAHVKSIGSPEALARIKNRGFSGSSTVNFIQGGSGKMIGQSLIVSAGPYLGFILKYDAPEYPGEYFAFNGADVTVSNIKPGQRSPLGDFVYRYKGLVKEGFLGGVISTGWPLLNIEQKKPTLKYSRAKVEGRELHVIEYFSKENMNDVQVKLFFDLDNFHHVRTEYRLKVHGEQALQAGQTVTRGGLQDSMQAAQGSQATTTTGPAGILDQLSESHYLLVEKFDNFKEVSGLTLPQSYAIEYSAEGQGDSFLADWNITASQWIQNGKIDQSFFKAH